MGAVKEQTLVFTKDISLSILLFGKQAVKNKPCM